MKMHDSFQSVRLITDLPLAASLGHTDEPPRTNGEVLFKNVRTNIVQSIRAFHPEELQAAAARLEQHFLYVNLSDSATRQEVLDAIGEAFVLPEHYGRNFDALYDCITDPLHRAGSQPGFIVVVEKIPNTSKFDREAREQLLDVFRDAADYWADRGVPFRCFYSFQ